MKRGRTSLTSIGPGNTMGPVCIGLIVMVSFIAGDFCRAADVNSRLDDFDRVAMSGLRTIADGAATNLSVYMDARVTEMLVCSALNERFAEALAAPEARPLASRSLGLWLKTTRAYEALLLLDKAGVCVAAAPESLLNADFSGNSAFQGALQGKPSFLDAHASKTVADLDPNSKGWTAAIAVPVKVENETAGVLLSFLKWSELEQLIQNIRIGATGYVWVVDSRNRVIIHPGKHLYGTALRSPPINLPSLDDAVTRKEPYHAYEFPTPITNKMDDKIIGLAYSKGYGNFPGLGWTIGAGAERWEMTAQTSILKMLLRRLFFR